LEIDIADFATPNENPELRIPLLEEGFDNGDFLRIGFSSNLDGMVIEGEPVPFEFQLDNIRLVNDVFPLDGDYNGDTIVDAADYVSWQKFAGTEYPLPNDPDGGLIGPAQYQTWRTNFARNFADGGQFHTPEPSGALLLVIAIVGGLTAPARCRL
jgi:hypothetical protein